MKRFIIITLFLIASFQGFSQQPLFIASGSNIYSLNLTNCTARFIGKAKQEFNDIAFTPDGKLWGIGPGLYQIDTTNATTTFIGISQVTTGGVSLAALNDSILLGEDFDSLWGINVKNAQSYNIGYIGYAAAGDLSWYEDSLYMTTDNQLIKIVLNNSFTSIVSSAPVNNINNPIPSCLGLVTIPINGAESLVGFADTDAYNISPITGKYQVICQSFPGAPGAASFSFPSSLPITLLDFLATNINGNISLQWQTTTEINSSYFSIERSNDGVNFSSIGKQAAAGNSNSLKQYLFIDNNPLSTNYYRLKEVDLDGNYKYSNILLVKMPQLQPLIIMGNPVQNDLQIQINNSTLSTNYLSIYDFMGRRLSSCNVQSGVQNIDVSSLTAGTYILQMITADGQVYDKVFVKGK